MDHLKTPRDVLVYILDKYNITEAQLCRDVGIAPSQLNRYLNQTAKKDIMVSTLWRIVNGLPSEARSEFWWRLGFLSLQQGKKNNDKTEASEEIPSLT